MADNYTRQGETFRALDQGGVKLPTLYVSTMVPTVVAGNQTISVGTGSDSTLTVPSGATHALLTVDTGGGNIRYWEDGSSPSTTAGLLVPAGAAAELTNLADVKMRATTGTVAVNVSYRKYDA